MTLRILCGGKWTLNGRWVVVAPDDTIVFDPPGLRGEGYDLRERQIKMSPPGPMIDWDRDPEDKGIGEFYTWEAAESLGECLAWRRAYMQQHPPA